MSHTPLPIPSSTIDDSQPKDSPQKITNDHEQSSVPLVNNVTDPPPSIQD